MVYSYTQISQYLTCPRRYRHRYLDGWREKDTRAAMLFGRAFESALAAIFRREDPAAVLFREWSACRNQDLQYSKDDSWDRSIGYLDRLRCLLEWKTTSSRYPEEPEGLLALDPQLVCYSWITEIPEVAQVVFVRKRLVEVQYLNTTITDEQRDEFGNLVLDTIQKIESAQFLPHSGIRFPQNPCSTCPYIGLCLRRQDLVEAALVRRPGAEDLGWLDELTY